MQIAATANRSHIWPPAFPTFYAPSSSALIVRKRKAGRKAKKPFFAIIVRYWLCREEKSLFNKMIIGDLNFLSQRNVVE